MRYLSSRAVAVAVYILLSLVWVYWVLDRQLFFGSDVAAGILIAAVALVHLALGFAIRRPWALALPLLGVALALPLGYPAANRGEPLPIWLGLLIWAPVEVALVAVGIGVARLVGRLGATSA